MATFAPITGTNLGLRTDLAKKVHNLSSDTIQACLATAIPATTTFNSGVTDLATGNGYTAGGNNCSGPSVTESGGVMTFSTSAPPAWTASGAGMGPFRYVLIVNTNAGKVLGSYDYGSNLTVPSGSTFTFTPGASHFTIS
jgi:LysM repeat protein